MTHATRTEEILIEPMFETRLWRNGMKMALINRTGQLLGQLS
jgi:hypothetical protein